MGKKIIHFIPAEEVCLHAMDLTVEDGVVKELAFVGGCGGNLQGIASLVKGMNIDDVISRLEGVKCGDKKTSCPDQLARALHMAKSQMEKDGME